MTFSVFSILTMNDHHLLLADMISYDRLGSWAESTCAALLIASHIGGIKNYSWASICFPLLIQCAGILVSLVTSFLATIIDPANRIREVNSSLRLQLIVASILMIPCIMAVTMTFLPPSFEIQGLSQKKHVTIAHVTLILIIGVFGGLAHSLISKS